MRCVKKDYSRTYLNYIVVKEHKTQGKRLCIILSLKKIRQASIGTVIVCVDDVNQEESISRRLIITEFNRITE